MLIAVSGGIGSGKTIVSRMLVAMGFKVYDCDSRAKAIMDADEDIKFYLKRDISTVFTTTRPRDPRGRRNPG